jgi:hypothetical protein
VEYVLGFFGKTFGAAMFALRMVARRWAMTKVVRPCIRVRRACCTWASVVASKVLVASSRMRMGGFLSSTGAMETHPVQMNSAKKAFAAIFQNDVTRDHRNLLFSRTIAPTKYFCNSFQDCMCFRNCNTTTGRR